MTTAVEMKECAGCRGFCGSEELTLDAESEVMLFRSWRCLIRHAIRMHQLSPEPRPAVRCDRCGSMASDAREGYDCSRIIWVRPYGGGDSEEARCSGILRRGWEDFT